MKIYLTKNQMCEIVRFVESSDYTKCSEYALKINENQIDKSDIESQLENSEKERKILLSEIDLMNDALVSCLVYFDALDLYHQDAIIKLLKERADSKVRAVLLR